MPFLLLQFLCKDKCWYHKLMLSSTYIFLLPYILSFSQVHIVGQWLHISGYNSPCWQFYLFQGNQDLKR